ncbi:hypothetical protein D018_3872B, partial [Vibrio parahaemolyticus VP2007-007]
NAPRTLLSAS